MKSFQGWAVAMVMAASLAACGGGGGGDDPWPGPDQQPQGFWQGTADDGRNAVGVVLANGRYMVLVSGPREATLETFMLGTFDSVNGTYVVGSEGFQFTRNQTDFNAGNGGQGAQFETRKSWTGSYAGNPMVNYKLGYVNDGVQASSLSQLAGTYSSWPVAWAPASSNVMTVNAGGVVSGTFFDSCTYVGQAVPTSQANVYDISLTFSGTCYLGNGTAKGMLFHDAANGRVFATAVDVVRSPSYAVQAVFMFAGPKVP